MSGITTGIGLFSGIDTASLIQQLLAVEARPRDLAQIRLFELQAQQAAYLDINSRLGALETAASVFRTDSTFQSKKAVSSDPNVLTAIAGKSAPVGTFSFLVDTLVSSQQGLSKGFSASDVGLGATEFVFEGVEARLDRDVALADLNGGAGVDRGKITITNDVTAKSVTVDLSKAATVGEVLDAINAADIDVTAEVTDQGIVLTQNQGESITVANADENGTATSLGIAGSGVSVGTTTDLYVLAEGTALSVLNDGNGVSLGVVDNSKQMEILVGGTKVDINLQGDEDTPAVSTVGDVIDRVNQQLADAGFSEVTLSLDGSKTGFRLEDSLGRSLEVKEVAGRTTAADLGLVGTGTGSIDGSRVLASLNSTLASNLLGGQGITGSGVVSINDRNGTDQTVDLTGVTTVDELLAAFADQTGGAITASLNETGNGITITDTTGGTGNLTVSGDTADDLGLTADVAKSSIDSGNLQHRYVTEGTTLSSLNDGKGLGTGTFRITDSTGASSIVDVGTDAKTLKDLIVEINSRPTRIEARINDTGDGILLFEPDDGQGGTTEILVEDVSGTIAKKLGIAGEAEGTGADNVIDGSFERTVEFEATDSLQQIADKINAEGVGVNAAVVNDGSGSAPFRLSLNSAATGVAGRFLLDTNGFDLGVETLDEGKDAKVFFGSTDPAKAVLLTSSSSTLDGVISGVSIDLTSTSTEPVQVTISRDTAAIEAKVTEFIDAFNEVVDRIDFQTRFDEETETSGPLLGDSTLLGLRNALFSTVQGEALGLEGPFTRLTQVGITVGDGGKLTLDAERLREAIDQDPEAVEALFAARKQDPLSDEVLDENGDPIEGVTVSGGFSDATFSQLGVAGLLEELADRYVDSIDGILTLRTNALDNQVQLQEDRIEAFNERLVVRQGILEQQFIAMEQALASLQTQQQALASLQFLG